MKGITKGEKKKAIQIAKKPDRPTGYQNSRSKNRFNGGRSRIVIIGASGLEEAGFAFLETQRPVSEYQSYASV